MMLRLSKRPRSTGLERVAACKLPWSKTILLFLLHLTCWAEASESIHLIQPHHHQKKIQSFARKRNFRDRTSDPHQKNYGLNVRTTARDNNGYEVKEASRITKSLQKKFTKQALTKTRQKEHRDGSSTSRRRAVANIFSRPSRPSKSTGTVVDGGADQNYRANGWNVNSKGKGTAPTSIYSWWSARTSQKGTKWSAKHTKTSKSSWGKGIFYITPHYYRKKTLPPITTPIQPPLSTPTVSPTPAPTPVSRPSFMPVATQTTRPTTSRPTQLSVAPTLAEPITARPTQLQTSVPTSQTSQPSTSQPTPSPTEQTLTGTPTTIPATATPTTVPATASPTTVPATATPTIAPATATPTTATPTTSTPTTVAPTTAAPITLAPTERVETGTPTINPTNLPVIVVEASTFTVEYTFDTIDQEPTEDQFTEGGQVTLTHFETFFASIFDQNIATDFVGNIGLQIATQDAPTISISFDLSSSFGIDSLFVPSTTDLDNLLIASLSAPAVNDLISQLNALDEQNPFHGTISASYRSGAIVPPRQQPQNEKNPISPSHWMDSPMASPQAFQPTTPVSPFTPSSGGNNERSPSSGGKKDDSEEDSEDGVTLKTITTSRFSFIYEFHRTPLNLPIEEEFEQAANTTFHYLDEFLVDHWSLRSPSNPITVTGTVSRATSTPNVTITYQLTIRSVPETTSSVTFDKMIFQALRKPNVDHLISRIRKLPESNPFSNTVQIYATTLTSTTGTASSSSSEGSKLSPPVVGVLCAAIVLISLTLGLFVSRRHQFLARHNYSSRTCQSSTALEEQSQNLMPDHEHLETPAFSAVKPLMDHGPEAAAEEEGEFSDENVSSTGATIKEDGTSMISDTYSMMNDQSLRECSSEGDNVTYSYSFG